MSQHGSSGELNEPSTPQPTPIPTPSPTPTPIGHGNPFDQPWLRPDTTIVIDAYQGNSIDWNKMAADSKVAGVVHRCSSGLKVDSQYSARKAIAIQRGYLWGAYHLGSSADPIAQAKLFLETVGSGTETLWILDLEDTSNSSMMSASDALRFLEYVYAQTGRIPVIYANHNVTLALNATASKNALLKRSKLWYARFRTNIPDFPSGIWSGYFLWQFSSEINCTVTGRCLYNVPGTLSDMDVNVFNGPRSELETLWHNNP